MTDTEISKQLALAIGHRHFDVRIGVTGRVIVLDKTCPHYWWRIFDYRDWRVIAPIAERYDCFPERCCGEWSAMVATDHLTWIEAETPQKAIALTIIGANK
jgi:hypothetical protein